MIKPDKKTQSNPVDKSLTQQYVLNQIMQLFSGDFDINACSAKILSLIAPLLNAHKIQFFKVYRNSLTKTISQWEEGEISPFPIGFNNTAFTIPEELQIKLVSEGFVRQTATNRNTINPGFSPWLNNDFHAGILFAMELEGNIYALLNLEFKEDALQIDQMEIEWLKNITQIITLSIRHLIIKQQKESERDKAIIVNRVANQKIEELNQINEARLRFYSILSHDLRSGISTAKMLSDLLLTHKLEIPSNDIREMIEMMGKICDESFLLLDNLLKWSNIQSNLTQLNRKNTDIRELIIETCKAFEPTAKIKNIVIRNHCCEQPVYTLVDAEMIKTVIRNLLTNAAKFSYPGGIIEVDGSFSDNKIIITVKDYGKGISEEDQKKLMKSTEAFTTEGTLNEKGNGLGLRLCSDIVAMHDGAMWFTSTQGKGSSFSFSLPYAPNPHCFNEEPGYNIN